MFIKVKCKSAQQHIYIIHVHRKIKCNIMQLDFQKDEFLKAAWMTIAWNCMTELDENEWPAF